MRLCENVASFACRYAINNLLSKPIGWIILGLWAIYGGFEVSRGEKHGHRPRFLPSCECAEVGDPLRSFPASNAKADDSTRGCLRPQKTPPSPLPPIFSRSPWLVVPCEPKHLTLIISFLFMSLSILVLSLSRVRSLKPFPFTSKITRYTEIPFC